MKIDDHTTRSIGMSSRDSGMSNSNNNSNNHGTMKQLLLFLFVGAILIWVSLWTLFATHTDVARETIYPKMDSTYFEKKAGARLFTYLGVFYIIAAAGILPALAMGCHLPRLPFWMLRTRRFLSEYWSNFEIMCLLYLVVLFAATVGLRVHLKYRPEEWDAATKWYETSKSLGKVLALIMMLLLLPISKSCFWLDVFNCKFERAVKFHRILGWFWALILIAHASTAMTALIMKNQFFNCMWPSDDCEKPGGWGTYKSQFYSRTITYGWVSATLTIPLLVASLPCIRRRYFEAFYYPHLGFLVVIMVLHLHFNDMIYYLAPGLAAYTLDKVLWLCCSRRPIRVISCSSPAQGYVRLVLAKEKCDYQPGNWVQLKVPAVSNWEWHPMSIAGVTQTTLTIDIKVLGDFTRRLHECCTSPGGTRPEYVFLDQFHGSCHTQGNGYLNQRAIVLVGGGIGLTPMLAALDQIVAEESWSRNVRRVVLVWVVKKLSVIDLYRTKLAHYQSLGTTRRGCQVDVHVYATLSEPEDPVCTDDGDVERGPQMLHQSNETTSSACPFSGPFIQYMMGYWHQFALTMAAGFGYLLGIFIANAIAKPQDLPFEYVRLLQIGLATAIAGGLVAIGMSGSVLRPVANWTSEASKSSNDDSCSALEDAQDTVPLDAITGRRPKLDDLMVELKGWCHSEGISSVGVSVCGPESCVEAVVRSCGEASNEEMKFLVSEETFEW